MKRQNKYHQLKRKYGGILGPFEKNLAKHGYEANTIRQMINYTAYFFNWKDQQGIAQAQYNDLLSFIEHCRADGDSTKLINRKLLSIRKYYEYLQLTDKTIKNPANGLYLKGNRKGIPKDLLEQEELKQLYESYPVYDLRTARNKVILGLLVNQALTTSELKWLEPGHIKLRSGKIEIPGSKHSNGRTLKLESHQILELQEYLTRTRPAILKAIRENMSWPGRKARKPDFKLIENQLFISMNGSGCIKNSLLHLTKGLKQMNPKVKDIKQIRQSVITWWLKQEDVRVVQYKAGHRYVSTTERYQAANLEDLEEALKQYHPLQ
ncbi:MAG: tyrosine-type recombinase/integrase [Tannerellaceae bacterium]|nr:tyrosine-type recombinase/integrase [Tannerellaceae bacterium]